jgi:3-oxoacyl-[acyl-carrier protein] reductase
MTSTSEPSKMAVLVTGASGDIGFATVIGCLNKGWHVFAACRAQSKLNTQFAEHSQYCSEKYPGRVTILEYDVTEQAAVNCIFKQIRQSPYQLIGLVNNAGVMHDSMIAMTSIISFEQQMLVNVTACFQHLQLASRLMTKHKMGCIVNVSSVVGLDGAAGQVAYSTSKASLLGMTKSAAKELAKLNIRVNAVAPGFIETQLTERYTAEVRQKIIDKIEMKRPGRASEVAATIVHLLSSDSAYITGQCIRVDGMMKV